jgi:hypothetical protein
VFAGDPPSELPGGQFGVPACVIPAGFTTPIRSRKQFANRNRGVSRLLSRYMSFRGAANGLTAQPFRHFVAARRLVMTISPPNRDASMAPPSPPGGRAGAGMASAPTEAAARTEPGSAGLDRLLVLLVAAGAAALAVSLWTSHAAAPDLLWRDVYHDRNGHFAYGLDLALAVKTFDPLWFLSELEKARVWPPLHGLILSAVLLVADIDHRLGIVPSLLGWVITIVLSWVIARRLFAARLPGVLAGAVAVTLTAASPAFRLLAADVMLEGLGAGLSALALFAAMLAGAEPARRARWRLLALTLTALFFYKGNYWGLVVVALALAYVSLDVGPWLRRAGVALRACDAGAARSALRDPLLVAAAGIAALVGLLYWRGPTSVVLFSQPLSLYPPENLVTVAYALLFIRAALAWRRNRAAFDAALGLAFGSAGCILFYWHAVPVAVSFLLPKRLATFLWTVGPANYDWEHSYDPLGGAMLYWRAFADGFHVAPWMAVLALALASIGIVRMWRTPPARGVVLLALWSAIAVIAHPQHQGRFLASWVFAVWICAGVGAGALFELALARRPRFVEIAVLVALVAAFAAANVWREPSKAAYATAIYPTEGPSDLELVRPYLDDLGGAREIMVATTFGRSDLFAWMIREHCRCGVAIRWPWLEHLGSRDEAWRVMAESIAQSNADVVVIVDAPHSGYALPSAGWTYDVLVGIVDAMEQQDRFVRVASYPVPGGSASVWRRRAYARSATGADYWQTASGPAGPRGASSLNAK